MTPHRAARPSPSPLDGPLSRFPVLGILALGAASVAAGIARPAIDEPVAPVGGTTPTGSISVARCAAMVASSTYGLTGRRRLGLETHTARR